MKATVTFDRTMPLRGSNAKGQVTLFDTLPDLGTGAAASPVEVLLEAMASCSMMDIIGILRKKRREVITLTAHLEAERAREHPKVFTSIAVRYDLASPDCTAAELDHAVSLSIGKYCSIAAMLRNGGCAITASSRLV